MVYNRDEVHVSTKPIFAKIKGLGGLGGQMFFSVKARP